MAKTIILSGGRYQATVDDSDFHLLSDFGWNPIVRPNTVYAMRSFRDGELKGSIFMHRQIMKCPDDMLVDHVNGNGLDNRRCNLRIATSHQNQLNRKNTKNRVGFKGVYWDKHRKAFIVRVCNKNLGRFLDPIEAAMVYDAELLKMGGDFAKTNLALGLLDVGTYEI